MFVGWWKQKMAIQERMRRRSCASSYWKFVECLRRREAARNCMCVFYDRGCLCKEYLGKGLLTVSTHSHLVTFNFSTSTFHSQNMMKLYFWMILTFKMILLQHAYLSTLQPCSWWAKVAQRWNYARHEGIRNKSVCLTMTTLFESQQLLVSLCSKALLKAISHSKNHFWDGHNCCHLMQSWPTTANPKEGSLQTWE